MCEMFLPYKKYSRGIEMAWMGEQTLIHGGNVMHNSSVSFSNK